MAAWRGDTEPSSGRSRSPSRRPQMVTSRSSGWDAPGRPSCRTSTSRYGAAAARGPARAAGRPAAAGRRGRSAGAGAGGSAACPQWPQKRKEPGSFAPQRTQVRSASERSAWPQPLQYAKEDSFSRPQRVQVAVESMEATLHGTHHRGQTPGERCYDARPIRRKARGVGMAQAVRPDHLSLPGPHRRFWDEAAPSCPPDRMMCDPFRTLAFGTDASFYRLIPKIVVKAFAREEVARLVALGSRLGVHLTFRAAGTSLSGQSISDSVLVVLAGGWRGWRIEDGGGRIALEPGVIGGRGQRLPGAAGAQDRPGPGLHQRLHDRRDRRQQRRRDVLRHGPEQLPDGAVDAARAGRRDRDRHRRPGLAAAPAGDPRRRSSTGSPPSATRSPPTRRSPGASARSTGSRTPPGTRSTPSSTTTTPSTSCCTSWWARRGRSPSSPR